MMPDEAGGLAPRRPMRSAAGRSPRGRLLALRPRLATGVPLSGAAVPREAFRGTKNSVGRRLVDARLRAPRHRQQFEEALDLAPDDVGLLALEGGEHDHRAVALHDPDPAA